MLNRATIRRVPLLTLGLIALAMFLLPVSPYAGLLAFAGALLAGDRIGERADTRLMGWLFVLAVAGGAVTLLQYLWQRF